MKPGRFEYARPDSLAEAVELVAQGDGMARVLAGGQSLLPMLNLRLAGAEVLVDVSRLPELLGAEETGDGVRFGAAVRHAEIEDGELPDPTRGLLRTVAEGLAYRAIRNRGTIGGSLALADPSAEWPAVLMATDAVLELRGPAGARQVAARDFVVGAYTTVLGPDEILQSITVPKLSPTARWGFFKACRKAGEYATSLAVVVVDRDRGIERAVLGAIGTAPRAMPQTAAAVAARQGWSEAAESALRDAVAADIAAGGLDLDGFERRIHGASMARAARQALGP
jgi:carbon-monoxide dehydrogenase medium subunit